MKKVVLMALMFCAFLTVSCSSDDSSKEKEPIKENPNPGNGGEEVKVTAEWEPATIKINTVIPLPVPNSIEYPHTEGCTKDFLQLKSNNTAKFFRYEKEGCKVTEYNQAFSRTGNNVSLNIIGYNISGTIKSETSTSMVIESDISQYKSLIEALYPQYSQYLGLLTGSKVELQLNKK